MLCALHAGSCPTPRARPAWPMSFHVVNSLLSFISYRRMFLMLREVQKLIYLSTPSLWKRSEQNPGQDFSPTHRGDWAETVVNSRSGSRKSDLSEIASQRAHQKGKFLKKLNAMESARSREDGDVDFTIAMVWFSFNLNTGDYTLNAGTRVCTHTHTHCMLRFCMNFKILDSGVLSKSITNIMRVK